MHRILLLSSLLLVACDSSNPISTSTKETPLNPITEAKANMAFKCVLEQLPMPSSEADVLFQYARWLQKNNQLKQDKSVDAEIERLYRIASENGHFKANINLQNGAMRGHFRLRGEEHLRMSEQLINAGVATGYYFVGIFLENGSAGLQKDHEAALRYYRKAADLGSALAQYYVGEKLEPIDVAPKIALQMYRCAAEQGNGKAATSLGVYLSEAGQYKEALEAFQLGVAAGDETAASFLDDGFRGPEPEDELNYLGLPEDLERAERYRKNWKIRSGYSYANPKVPEINDIVPLPPAPLPAWDGKLQWLEERLANIPPEKPSEALINQLAKAKRLDPATGQGLPGSPAFSQAHLSAPDCFSGQACPVSGYWKVAWVARHHSVNRDDSVRYFEQGEIFPMQLAERYHARIWPFSDKITRSEQPVKWCLM